MDIISISWGLDDDIPEITEAVNKAYNKGIVILASASNRGANDLITFPVRLRNVFCIGASDGKGGISSFNPPFVGVEKYSALGEAVYGADVLTTSVSGTFDQRNPTTHSTFTRRTGTSTATPIAAGIAAVFLDYTRQFTDAVKGPDNFARVRKLFIEMSKASVNLPYRYLVPWSLFDPTFNSQKCRQAIQDILQRAPGIHCLYSGLTSCYSYR